MIAVASDADLPALARLMATSALLTRYGLNTESALTSLSTALRGGDLILVCRGIAIEGFAWLSFAPRMLGGAAYLRLLLSAHPGHGVGAKLLDSAEHQARERANHMYLLATTDNVGARRFYERLGYQHVGDLPGLVVPDVDEALYHKPLRG